MKRSAKVAVVMGGSSAEREISIQTGSGVMRALQEEFRLELTRRDIDSITSSAESAVVTVVGAGMRHTTGISGKVFGALGQAGVNVIAIAQGSSECSISLVVTAAEADTAVRAIHVLIVEQLNGKNGQ